MFVDVDELKSVIYTYQLNEILEITEEDDSNKDMILMAINAAVEEIASYLRPNNQGQWSDGRPRYDVDKIFAATGSDRNALILEFTKILAVWYIIQLSNVDIEYTKIRERYDRAIDWLEKVSGVGKYSDKPGISAGLPLLVIDPESIEAMPFRYGSREKFNHE